MSINFSKPLPTIGVDKYTFFKVISDDSTETEYDTPVSLPGTVEISPTDSGGVEIFEADNGIYETAAYIEKQGHTITNADIPPAVDAMWRGLELKNGLCEVTNDIPIAYFGVAWRILKSDGTYRYVRYYKGSYSFGSNVGGKTKAVQSSLTAQTAKAEFTAVMRESDSAYYAYMDEVDIPSSMNREDFEQEWFTDLNWYPTV